MHILIIIIQVVFPLERQLQGKDSMFWALALENNSNKTPLMVAIDNNNYR